VKTYSLAGLLVVLGFLALERALRGTNIEHRTSNVEHRSGEEDYGVYRSPPTVHSLQSTLHAFLSGALLALAAGVRLSAGILLPVVWLSLLAQWLRSGREGTSVLIGFLVGGAVALLAVYVPFMVVAPEALKFGLLDYHGSRTVGSVVVMLAYKAGFLIRLTGAYFPVVALGVGAWIMMRPEREDRSADQACLLQLLLSSVLMVTIVHLIAVFPYDDYEVFIMPLLAVAVAVCLSESCPTSTPSTHSWALIPVFCLVLLAHSAASPLLQGWLLAKRDRIWWPLRTETSLQVLQRAGRQVRELIEEDLATREASSQIPLSAFSFQLSTLLTQDTYLAVETGMRVPDGMELGPFCYLPDMAREKAEACHVLNRDMLHEALATCDAPVAAFSGYGLSIRCPEIMQLPIDERAELWTMVESRYEESTEVAPFGQADTVLRVFRRK